MRKWEKTIHWAVGVVTGDVLTKRFIGHRRELANRKVWQPENAVNDILKLPQIGK
jgi:hypothetical protein